MKDWKPVNDLYSKVLNDNHFTEFGGKFNKLLTKFFENQK